MLKITKRHLLYDIISGASAVTAVILILIDYSEHLSPWQLALNRGIWLIFILDYVTRLIKAPYKERFFVHNIWDLAALLPFHGIFPCCPVKGIDSLLRLESWKNSGVFVPSVKKSRSFSEHKRLQIYDIHHNSHHSGRRCDDPFCRKHEL